MPAVFLRIRQDSDVVGNEAPEVSVDALLAPDLESDSDFTNAAVRTPTCYLSKQSLTTTPCPQWTEILPRVPLGPSSQHLFKIPDTTRFNYLKLNMYPDGGIVSIPPVVSMSYQGHDRRHVSGCMAMLRQFSQLTIQCLLIWPTFLQADVSSIRLTSISGWARI